MAETKLNCCEACIVNWFSCFAWGPPQESKSPGAMLTALAASYALIAEDYQMGANSNSPPPTPMSSDSENEDISTFNWLTPIIASTVSWLSSRKPNSSETSNREAFNCETSNEMKTIEKPQVSFYQHFPGPGSSLDQSSFLDTSTGCSLSSSDRTSESSKTFFETSKKEVEVQVDLVLTKSVASRQYAQSVYINPNGSNLRYPDQVHVNSVSNALTYISSKPNGVIKTDLN